MDESLWLESLPLVQLVVPLLVQLALLLVTLLATPLDPSVVVSALVVFSTPATPLGTTATYLPLPVVRVKVISLRGRESAIYSSWLTFIADLHNYHSFWMSHIVLYIKQPLGNLERQLLHMSYSHTQHTWVMPSFFCHTSNSSNPSGAPSGNCFTRLAHSPDTPGYSSSCLSSLSLFLIQATPREPRAAIASHDLLTLLTHLGILPHAYLLCHYF